MAPLTFLSLNEDVLSEILSFLLLDTPREPNRTSILRTCSLLHSLGLPPLYRVVDLREPWETLLAKGGVLTVEGRNPNVGRCVQHLRLDGAALSFSPSTPHGIPFPKLNLPSCTSLLLDLARIRSDYLDLHSTILPQLPILDLILDCDYHRFALDSRFITNSFGTLALVDAVPVLSPQPQNLRSLTFRNTLWYDESEGSSPKRKLSLSDWTFRVLVVRFDKLEAYGDERWEEEGVVELFLDVEQGEQGSFLKGTKRIEFRGGAPVEEQFREEVAKRIKAGLSEFETRIASLIVFVDKDGTDRRLLEAEFTLWS